jgi:hypothetical protein
MITIIADQIHAEEQGRYRNLSDALSELQRLSQIPWDQEPNKCPCMSWQTCSREYEIIEYDNSFNPWKETQRFGTLEISSKGVFWTGGLENGQLRNVSV